MADNELTGKKAGIPKWAFVVGSVIVILGGYYFYKARQAAASNTSQSAQTTASTTNTDTSGLATDQYEQLLAQLRALQGDEANEGTPSPNPSPPKLVSPPVYTSPPTSPPPPPPPTQTTPTPTGSTPNVVTVKPYPDWSSTLFGIAQKEYGDGSQYPKIFSANQNLIIGQEEAHGMTAAQAQERKWLYPGEAITIP